MICANRKSTQLLAAVVVSASLLAGCSSVKNLFGKSKDKGIEPTPLVDITPSVTVKQLWSGTLGEGEGSKLGIGQHPVVVDGRVYAAAVHGGVTAFDLHSGQVAWHYASELPLSGGPGAGEGLVVVGSLEGDVIALNSATGVEKWKAKVGNEVLAAPAISDGQVFVHSNDGRVSAFDAATGERHWFYDEQVPALSVRGTSGMTMGPGFVFVGSDGGKLTALKVQDGSVLWSTAVAEPEGRNELDRMADVDGSAVLDGRTLFATSYRNRSAAIDGPSGQLIWRSEHGGARGLGLSNSAIIISDRDGNVVALDKNSGGSLWQQSALAYRNVTAPVVQGDYAVVADYEGVVHWLSLKDGSFAARARVGSTVTGQPIEQDGVLVVQTIDGKLAAFAIQ